nr:MAG TPA: hypothetical protein [Caudoviricetes sp.]
MILCYFCTTLMTIFARSLCPCYFFETDYAKFSFLNIIYFFWHLCCKN